MLCRRSCCLLLLAVLAFAAQPGFAQLLNRPYAAHEFRAGFELGFIDVLSHYIQFGQTGTRFDYVKHGGQNVLFLFRRLTAELHLSNRHGFVFLYQPLEVRTEALLSEDLVVDDLTFPANTPMDLRYGFDFYRVSYLYDFARDPETELAIGPSLQLRNASISFTSKDGQLFRINQGIGPVPILKLRGRTQLTERSWVAAEIDGFYASGRIITGSRNDFAGAILDASARYGLSFNEWLEAYINLRYLGGGARGTEEDDPGPGDGYTDNWLSTAAVTLGFYVR